MATTAQKPVLDRQPATQADDGSSFLLREKGGDEGGALDAGFISRQTAQGVETLPTSHHDRVRPKFDFPKALRHFSKVLKDKEKTEELIGVFDALPWRAVHDEAIAFLNTEHGKAIYRSEPYLPELLDDHAKLRKTPKGSFAHAYCDFMERENLSAFGLVEASGDTRNGMGLFEDGVEWYNDRLRDTHDLLHIVTGYERDTLGEQCLLAFLFHQRPSPGHLFLASGGTLLMKAKLKTKAPILRAFFEGLRNGKGSKRIVEQPILELLSQPLEKVRQDLGVKQPHVYFEVLRIFRSEGIDPHAFLAAADAQ